MASMVHLMRHGEVDNPRHVVYARLPGYGLSARGRGQAEAASRYLIRRPVVSIWSSPLQRALETAEVIAARFQLTVRVHPDLTEWRFADGWAGIVWEDLPRQRPGQLEQYLATPWDLDFGEETLDDLASRIAGVVRDLDDHHPEGDVVLVSHQDPVQAGRIRLTGRDLSELGVDKPGHASVLSFRLRDSWEEVARWDAPDAEAFPPQSDDSSA